MNPENDDGQEEIGIHTEEQDNDHNDDHDDDHDDKTMIIVMTVKMTNQAGRDSGMRSSEKTSRREEERRSAQARSTWRKKRGYSINWDGQNKKVEFAEIYGHPSPRCFGRH